VVQLEQRAEKQKKDLWGKESDGGEVVKLTRRGRRGKGGEGGGEGLYEGHLPRVGGGGGCGGGDLGEAISGGAGGEGQGRFGTTSPSTDGDS
jgi:hypothetical protein